MNEERLLRMFFCRVPFCEGMSVSRCTLARRSGVETYSECRGKGVDDLLHGVIRASSVCSFALVVEQDKADEHIVECFILYEDESDR